MKSENAILALQNNLSFESRTAIAYVRAGGYCEYCGEELICSRIGYATAQIDHILPKSMFDEDISSMCENFALSCSLCNGIKNDVVVLQEGEDPVKMLKTDRSKLVNRASALIKEKRKECDRLWNISKQIFKILRDDFKNGGP